MDHMDWLSVLLVSVPEEFLFILMTALVVGRKDIIKINNKYNVIKIIIAAILTALSTFVMRYVCDNMSINTIVQLVFFIIVYTVLLRFKWYEAAIGLMMSIAVFAVLELICLALITKFTGVTLDQALSDTVTRFLYSIPSRLTQVAIIYLLYRLPFKLVNLGMIEKFTSKILRKILLMTIYLLMAFVQVIMTMKYFIFDNKLEDSINQSFFWLNILFTLVLSIILVITTNKLSNSIRFEKQEQVACLMWFKTLLNEYGNDTRKISIEVEQAINKYGRREVI